MSDESRGLRPLDTDAAESSRPLGGTEEADYTHRSEQLTSTGEDRSTLDPDNAEWPTVDASRYQVKGEHARGGLGRILAASDTRMDRPVAVKELLNGGVHGEARFIREALVTARLQHPAIVPVYEVGRWPDGKPFYSMKMVEGRSLSKLIKEKKTLQERLALLPHVIAVADAVAYAHEKRVIHRDLKPSNILIGPFGETMVIDWGLATDLSQVGRRDGDVSTPYEIATAGLTMAGTVMGTPEYMPPEQAQGQPVDERADVYALGAILYTLLAGSPPYTGKSSAEVLERVTTCAPPPLEECQRGVPKDLSAIVRKAMARAAGERYAAANEFVQELKRFQTGQLVGAYSYSRIALVHRWLRRNKVSLSIVGASLIVLAAVIIASFHRIIREKNTAQAQRSQAEDSRNRLILVQAQSWLERDPTKAIAWLKTYPPSATDWQSVYDIARDADSRIVARHVFPKQSVKASYVAFSPDSKTLATQCKNWIICLVDTESGKRIKELKHQGDLQALEFSPDGEIVSFHDWDATTLGVWYIHQNKVRSFHHNGTINERRFSPDGKMIASASSDKTIGLWSLTNEASRSLVGHDSAVTTLDFSPDSQLLASGGADQTVRLWNVVSGASKLLGKHAAPLRKVLFSPNGHLLASVSIDGLIRLWNLSDGRASTYVVAKTVWKLAFSPDGQLLAATAGDGTVSLFDVYTKAQQTLRGHQGATTSLAFTGDGKTLGSAGEDGLVFLWDLTTGGRQTLRGHGAVVSQLLFSNDAKYAASSSDDRTVRVWDLAKIRARTKILAGHNDQVQHVVFSPDGRHISTASRDGTVRIWVVATGEQTVKYGHQGLVFRSAFSPDGTKVASASFDGTVRVWTLPSSESFVLAGHQRTVWDVKFSHAGSTIASAGADGTIRLWSVPSYDSRILKGHEGDVRSLAFSPDDALVASVGNDHTVRLWNLENGSVRIWREHDDLVHALSFSPDGRFLASGSYDKTIRVWEVRTGQSRLLGCHEEGVRSIAFSSDGRMLVSASKDGAIRIWDLATGATRPLVGHHDQVNTVAFSPDGAFLASASHDNTVRLWSIPTASLEAIFRHEDHVLYLAFAPDGRFLASASTDKSVRLWPIPSKVVPILNSSDFSRWTTSITTAQLTRNNELAPP